MTESRVFLRKSETNELVESSLLDEVTDHHLALWNGSWRPAMEAYCAGRVLRDKPEDHHWDWKWKANEWRPLLGYHSFAIVCENDLQGLMVASDFKSARLQAQFGKPIVYVEFVATAPWNRPELQNPPRYRGVGTVMVAAAVELSWDLGYRGRIGLHSLPKAEPFYRESCGMTELGKDAAHQNLMYYEMTDNQADRFRQK
ncbi:MAG: GNAT family N-acetyltransferase [Verrucomicrobia bacterium]|nr:MAG: GNAT family N-acetyltransferase [Verrucomicrobiota bacterium]